MLSYIIPFYRLLRLCRILRVHAAQRQAARDAQVARETSRRQRGDKSTRSTPLLPSKNGPDWTPAERAAYIAAASSAAAATAMAPAAANAYKPPTAVGAGVTIQPPAEEEDDEEYYPVDQAGFPPGFLNSPLALNEQVIRRTFSSRLAESITSAATGASEAWHARSASVP